MLAVPLVKQLTAIWQSLLWIRLLGVGAVLGLVLLVLCHQAGHVWISGIPDKDNGQIWNVILAHVAKQNLHGATWC